MKTLSCTFALAVGLAFGTAPCVAQNQEPAGAPGASVPSSPRNQVLTADQVREDLSITRQALEQIHPGYTRYTSQGTLDALWQDASTKALANPTRGNIYLQISRVLAAIRCDHTKAELPADFEKARQEEPLYLPFRYAIFDNRLFVVDPGDTDLIGGAEILAIDGTPTSEVIAKVFELFPVDGDTDYIKGESVVAQGEFMGPAFDHFYPFLFETRPEVTLKIAGMDDVTVKRWTYAEFEEQTGTRRFASNFDSSVTFKLLDDRAAYLSVDTFVNYRRPVDPDTIYGPVFERMAKSGRDTLILDLRRNGGGSNDAQMGLVQWLMPSAFRQADAMLVKSDRIDPAIKPYLTTWEKAALNPDPAWFKQRADGLFEIVNPFAGKPAESVPAKPGAFKGKLIVLTSTDNASGVTHLLSVLRTQRPDTVFFGEKTGGASTGATAGILFTLNLPNSGAKVRVPLQRTVIAQAEKLDPRGGITPDILAEDTLLSTLAGTDPAMEAAVAYLSKTDP
ncbi:MAG: S41 family peptidase [Pseudomonadota bacterium]